MEDIIQNVYFWLSMTGLMIGLFHYSIKMCCSSNCNRLKICGVTLVEKEIDPNILTRNLSNSV